MLRSDTLIKVAAHSSNSHTPQQVGHRTASKSLAWSNVGNRPRAVAAGTVSLCSPPAELTSNTHRLWSGKKSTGSVAYMYSKAAPALAGPGQPGCRIPPAAVCRTGRPATSNWRHAQPADIPRVELSSLSATLSGSSVRIRAWCSTNAGVRLACRAEVLQGKRRLAYVPPLLLHARLLARQTALSDRQRCRQGFGCTLVSAAVR